jgi:hypothetical protein
MTSPPSSPSFLDGALLGVVWRWTGEEQASCGPSTRIASVGLDPIDELSGFPLIPCLDCHLARVVEGRTKDSENYGRLYFKCARNGMSCLLDFPKLALFGL